MAVTERAPRPSEILKFSSATRATYKVLDERPRARLKKSKWLLQKKNASVNTKLHFRMKLVSKPPQFLTSQPFLVLSFPRRAVAVLRGPCSSQSNKSWSLPESSEHVMTRRAQEGHAHSEHFAWLTALRTHPAVAFSKNRL